MAKYYAVVQNENSETEVNPFLAWVRTNQDQFENPILLPNTHNPFRKVVQLGWVRRDYNGDVYGIRPDENGEFDYAEAFFNNEVLPDPEEEGNDIEEIVQGQQIALRLEKELLQALRLNINTLENGLEIIDGGFERKVLNGGRIDILCRGADERLVVIELKAGKAKPEALAQILDYIADLKEETDSEVRGIIVAHNFDRRLVNAVRETPQVRLKKYAIQFTFDEVNG